MFRTYFYMLGGIEMNIAYVRVSTVDQNEDRQIEGLKPYGIEKWFIEKVSAKDTNRPELKNMLDFARDGDTVYVHDFSRIARNVADLLKLIEQLEKNNVQLVSNKEKIDSSTPTGKLMLTVIGAINEFERAILLERQKEGIAIAKKKGAYKGRQTVKINDFDEWYKKLDAHEVSKTELARILHVSRPTLDKLIKQKLTIGY